MADSERRQFGPLVGDALELGRCPNPAVGFLDSRASIEWRTGGLTIFGWPIGCPHAESSAAQTMQRRHPTRDNRGDADASPKPADATAAGSGDGKDASGDAGAAAGAAATRGGRARRSGPRWCPACAAPASAFAAQSPRVRRARRQPCCCLRCRRFSAYPRARDYLGEKPRSRHCG